MEFNLEINCRKKNKGWAICKPNKRKPDKMRVDQGSEFYSNSFKEWLKDNDIQMYSTNSERKSVVAEKFIKSPKNKIYKHMTAMSKKSLF